jgi:hypothetical protein
LVIFRQNLSDAGEIRHGDPPVTTSVWQPMIALVMWSHWIVCILSILFIHVRLPSRHGEGRQTWINRIDRKCG